MVRGEKKHRSSIVRLGMGASARAARSGRSPRPYAGAVFVLSISSLKGGVGKTTVTLGLASAAWTRGIRTLVVDLDPQCDASTGLGLDAAGIDPPVPEEDAGTGGRSDAPDLADPPARATIADVLASPDAGTVRRAISPAAWTRGGRGGLDVLAGGPEALRFDSPAPTREELWRLEEALVAVQDDYDLVLVDCPPSLGALTRIAWLASDRVLVVTEPGLFSVSAADRALRGIDELRRAESSRLQPLGIVVNRARMQSNEHRFRVRELRDLFGPLVLMPVVPERTAVQQAQGAAAAIHAWPGDAAQASADAFDGVLERIARTAGLRGGAGLARH